MDSREMQPEGQAKSRSQKRTVKRSKERSSSAPKTVIRILLYIFLLELLYAVTGWDKTVLPWIHTAIQEALTFAPCLPDFHFCEWVEAEYKESVAERTARRKHASDRYMTFSYMWTGILKWLMSWKKRSRKGKIKLALYALLPVITCCHPYAKAMDCIESVIHVIRDYDHEDAPSQTEKQECFANVPLAESPVTQQTELSAVQQTMPSAAQQTTPSAVQPPQGNSGAMLGQSGAEETQNAAPQIKAHFWLGNGSGVEAETMQEIENLILYQFDSYKKEKNVEAAVRDHLEKLSLQEPDYMEEIFPQKDVAEDASALYTMENEFEQAILTGQLYGKDYIPNSRLLDLVIAGRASSVRLLKSYQMASALANNYLKYALEYIYQERTEEKEQLYYLSMAILAGQLQYCYAETEQEKQETLEWLYARYYEIRELKLIESTRLDDIVNCLDSLRREHHRGQ